MREGDAFPEGRAHLQGYIDVFQRIEAIRQMRQMEAAAVAEASWTSIGPRPMNAPAGSSRYAGRVSALALGPGNPNQVYAGADGGGFWKSTDGGSHWAPLGDQWNSMMVKSIAVAPTDSNLIYVGTGYPGSTCLYVTTDGGSTWSNILTPCEPKSFSIVSSVAAIAVSPTDSRIVLVGTAPGAVDQHGGIWRSADTAKTWQKVSSATTYRLFWDSLNPLNVYSSGDSGVAVSRDGGLTWNPANGTANALPSGGRVDLAVSPSQPLIMYAATKDSASAPLFFRSDDGGQNWRRLGAPAGDAINYWPWTLSVHPIDPNVVFAGSLWLHRSLDGGAIWQNVSSPGGGAEGLHVDQQSLAFAPDGNKLYEGNDGGAWSTANPRANPINWTNLNDTFTTAMFYAGLSINPLDVNDTLGGTQDNGTVRYRGTQAWAYGHGGDGYATAINPQDPRIRYTNSNGGPYQSLDSGASWSAFGGAQQQATTSSILVMDPSQPNTLYAGWQTVWQTRTGAGGWQAISPTYPFSSGFSFITVAPSDSNTVFAGGLGGKVLVTRNALAGTSAVWVDRSQGLPNLFVHQVAANDQDPSTAYAVLAGSSVLTDGGHVYKTTNGGQSWVNTGGANLPNISVNDIILDPDAFGVLYAGTDIGVFRSTDDGKSWLPLGSGLPKAVVTSVKLHPATRTLRAGTYGRGMWDLPVPLTGQGLAPAISISMTHTGNFTQDQRGATYTISVSNRASAGPASGTVTVTETTPAGLTLQSMAGAGWRCSANTCARSDGLAAGTTYPPITITVNVAADATSPQVNQVIVSGGGSAQATATDSTIINKSVNPNCMISLPLIASVKSAGDFGGFSAFASGSWLEVKGSNLALNTLQWSGSDFHGVNAPVSLDGTSVSINGKPGFVFYISPSQVNVQAPADSATGAVQVTVSNCAGVSTPVSAQKSDVAPGMLAPPAFKTGGIQYLVALFPDGATYVGPSGFLPGYPSRPAKPGDSITAYGIGFGSVTPLISPGVIVGQANSIPGLTVTFGSVPAAITYAGLAPNYVGLYQFNFTVPNVADKDYQVDMSVGGSHLQQSLFLSVRQ